MTRGNPLCAVLLLVMVASGVISAACSRRGPRQRGSTGPSVAVPQFSIEVKLSPAADGRLRSMGESIEVVAYFDGDALPGQAKYNPPMRDVYLGRADRLVDDKSVAHFDDVKIPQLDWNRLSDKDYFVTINTVSARRVARDNLLHCTDPIDVKISAIQHKTTEITCRLIGEDARSRESSPFP